MEIEIDSKELNQSWCHYSLSQSVEFNFHQNHRRKQTILEKHTQAKNDAGKSRPLNSPLRLGVQAVKHSQVSQASATRDPQKYRAILRERKRLFSDKSPPTQCG